MALDEAFQDRVAEHRARTRQDRAIPFLIRDDGVLFPNVPLIAKKQNFRPYHGPVDAPLEERMQYLKGLPARRRVINTAVKADEDAPFDIAKASKDDLIQFAEEQFGVTLDPALHLNRMRADVARLAGVGNSREPASNAGDREAA